MKTIEGMTTDEKLALLKLPLDEKIKQYDYCMNQLGLKTVIDEYLKCSPRKGSK